MASLYVHIPFCERKCLYCDFASVERKELIPRFLASLNREAEMRSATWGSGSFGTLYYGGGTPSLLDIDSLASLMAALQGAFALDPAAEVALEVNPGTVTGEKLRAYRDIGINRLSIGIQSFSESELRFLGRIHTVTEAIGCVEMARGAGFTNLSIDLIYAVPGQSVASWADTLRRAVSLDPPHISAYSLIVEEGTPLDRMVRSGDVVPAGDELQAEMYEWTMRFLGDAGFEQYEVSNYARPGFRSRHNFAYWSHDDYVGLGPSAHSFARDRRGLSARRVRNVSSVTDYCDMLERNTLPVESEEELSLLDLANERIFLGLRADGLDLELLGGRYGVDLPALRQPVIAGILEGGLAVMSGRVLRLTAKGYLLCDEIARRLLVP